MPGNHLAAAILTAGIDGQHQQLVSGPLTIVVLRFARKQEIGAVHLFVSSFPLVGHAIKLKHFLDVMAKCIRGLLQEDRCKDASGAAPAAAPLGVPYAEHQKQKLDIYLPKSKTTALLDRLTHHGRILETESDSFRFKASAASGKTEKENAQPLTKPAPRGT